jgi:hypothetical protein
MAMLSDLDRKGSTFGNLLAANSRKRSFRKQSPHAFELFFDLAFAAAFTRAVSGLSSSVLTDNVEMKALTFAILWFAWVEDMLYSNFTHGSQAESVKAAKFFMVCAITLAASAEQISPASWAYPLGKPNEPSVLHFSVAMAAYNFVLVVAYVFHLSNVDAAFAKLIKICRRRKLDHEYDERNDTPRQRLSQSQLAHQKAYNSIDIPLSSLMITKHFINMMLFSVGIFSTNMEAVVVCWVAKIGLNMLSLLLRRQLVMLELMDPPSPTHIGGRLTRITLIMLAQIFAPASAQLGTQAIIKSTDFRLMNFVVLLDILGVYCIWCLVQHAHKFATAQNYKRHLDWHVILHGLGVSGIAMINASSSQFYRFSLCHAETWIKESVNTTIDVKSNCYASGLRGHGAAYTFQPVNTVLLLRSCTALVMGCGFVSFVLLGFALTARLQQDNGFNLQHKRSASRYCCVMVLLYGTVLLALLPPVPWLIYWSGHSDLPKNAQVGDNPAAGYGSSEGSKPFKTIAGLYIAYKLVPLIVLILERIADKQHRHRLRKAERAAAGSKEGQSAACFCCSMSKHRARSSEQEICIRPSDQVRLEMPLSYDSASDAGAHSADGPSTSYVALSD